MMYEYGSKREMEEERPEFAALPDNIYRLNITKVERQKKKKYGTEEMEDVMTFTFDIVSLGSGEEAKDVDGASVKNRKMFFDGKKNKEGEWSMGFSEGGTVPSRLRALTAHALGLDVDGKITFESWEQFLGKTVNAFIVKYKNKKGEVKNKIDKFLESGDTEIPKTLEEGEDEIPFIEDDEEIDVKDIPF